MITVGVGRLNHLVVPERLISEGHNDAIHEDALTKAENRAEFPHDSLAKQVLDQFRLELGLEHVIESALLDQVYIVVQSLREAKLHLTE